MLDAGLDQFEQPDRVVGQLRNGAVGPGNGVAAVCQVLRNRAHVCGQPRLDMLALIRQAGDLPGEPFKLRADFGMPLVKRVQMFVLRTALADCGVIQTGHLIGQLSHEFTVPVVKFAAALSQLLREQAVAFSQPVIDQPGLVSQFGQPAARGFHRLAVNLANLLDRAAQIVFEFADRRLPCGQGARFAVAQGAHQRRAFIAHRTQPGAQRGQAIGLVHIEQGPRLGQFGAQCCGPAAHRRQGRDFVRVELGAEIFAGGLERAKALLGGSAHSIGMRSKFGDRARHGVAQRFDLALARLAKFVELLKPADQLGNLRMRVAARRGDVVGHVLGRTGDHRQLPAQFFHVFKRRRADGSDRIDPCAVVVDQFGEPLRMLRQSLGGNAAQRVDIARLRRDKFARQA